MVDNVNPTERSQEMIDLAERTLLGDMRDALIEWDRRQTKVWRDLSENDQRNMALSRNQLCVDVIRGCAGIMLSRGVVEVRGEVAKVDITDKGIVAKMAFRRGDERRHDLYDAQGSIVTVMLADVQRFMGERGPAAVVPDQPGLPLEALQVEPDEPPAPEPNQSARHTLGDRGHGDTMTGSRLRDSAIAWLPSAADWTEGMDPEARARTLGRMARRHNVPRGNVGETYPDGGDEAVWWLAGWDQADANAQGMDAHGGDIEREANPYEAETDSHVWWHEGWDAAEAAADAEFAESRGAARLAEQAETGALDGEPDVSGDVPVKRGRGRPRKSA